MGAEVSREGMSGETGLGDLPEGCLAEIMIRLDPPEICRLARLCRTFRGAASADHVWEAKLPGNYRYLLGKVLENENSQGRKLSKKEIFALLCRRNAFNGSNTEIFLEKNSCLICMSISSKELLITGISDRRHWNFIPTPESSHVYYMSGDAWKEGGIDATGALMVLTLKVISCAINYSDGLLKDESLSEAQKKYRLICCPSLIEYIGYCLCCGSHFAGPVFEMKDYLEWTECRGIWSPSRDNPLPSLLGATLRALLQAAICMGLYLQLVPKFPLSRFNEPIYQDWGFWQMLFYQYMSGFTARWKYYFIWSISEAAIIVSGLGFSGWSGSSPRRPLWDRAKNVDVLGVEFATSAVQLPLVWNIQVSTWLRHYVYERLIQKGKKPGFFQLLATQTISAVWHGLYPGYIMFFVQSALMIAGSRVIYRWQQAVKPKYYLLRKMLTLTNFAYTLLVLNYSCIGFMVLSFKETLASYQSVYFVGTIVPIVVILLGYIIKPAKPARLKTQKTQ